jgi:hypothetical protein
MLCVCVCVSICVFSLLNSECLNQSLYHDIWAHRSGVRHKSLPPVCVSVFVSLLLLLGNGSVKWIHAFIARQRLGKHVLAVTNTWNNKRTLGRVCLWICLCISLKLLGDYSVKAFPRQRRIVGGVVSYEVRIVSKESRWLLLPRTSYFNCSFGCLHWNYVYPSSFLASPTLLIPNIHSEVMMVILMNTDSPKPHPPEIVSNINDSCD